MDWKSALNLYCQGEGLGSVNYAIVYSDDPIGWFEARATCGKRKVFAVSLKSHRTKAEAEQDAAQELYKRMVPTKTNAEVANAILAHTSQEPRRPIDISKSTGLILSQVKQVSREMVRDRVLVAQPGYKFAFKEKTRVLGQALSCKMDYGAGKVVIRLLDMHGHNFTSLGPFDESAVETNDEIESLVEPVFLAEAQRNFSVVPKAAELYTRRLLKNLKAFKLLEAGSTLADLVEDLRCEVDYKSIGILAIREPDAILVSMIDELIVIVEVGITDDLIYADTKFGKYYGCSKIIEAATKKKVKVINLIDDTSVMRFIKYMKFPVKTHAERRLPGDFFEDKEMDMLFGKDVDLLEEARRMEDSLFARQLAANNEAEEEARRRALGFRPSAGYINLREVKSPTAPLPVSFQQEDKLKSKSRYAEYKAPPTPGYKKVKFTF